MSGTLSEDLLEAARDYLADFLYDEDWHGDESQDWFAELGDYASQLPLDDPLITSAALHDLRDYLVGFLDAMGRDHARWEELVAEQGKHARWTSSAGHAGYVVGHVTVAWAGGSTQA